MINRLHGNKCYEKLTIFLQTNQPTNQPKKLCEKSGAISHFDQTSGTSGLIKKTHVSHTDSCIQSPNHTSNSVWQTRVHAQENENEKGKRVIRIIMK